MACLRTRPMVIVVVGIELRPYKDPTVTFLCAMSLLVRSLLCWKSPKTACTPAAGSPTEAIKDTLVAAAAATLLEVSRVLTSDSEELEATTPAPTEKRIMVPISPFSKLVSTEPLRSKANKPYMAQKLQVSKYIFSKAKK